jgi:peptide-methionine (S)-S-oxide reductase
MAPMQPMNPDTSSLSPLSAAARAADDDAVRTLLSNGEPVDGRDGDIDTPLWHACYGDAPIDRRIAVALRLLDAGAAVRRGCRDNATAVHAAAWRGPLAMVDLLIRHGGMSWHADRQGRTPLDYARAGLAADKASIMRLLDRPVIDDPLFRQAVRMIHDGNVAGLDGLLADHPNLLHDRPAEPDCYPQDYFRDPRLFWFVANNPTLMTRMPANIADVARTMVDRGVAQADLDYTLELVMTSSAAREQAHQIPLMRLLVQAGAVATRQAIFSTLAHRETAPIQALLDSGMKLTAPVAAGLGHEAELGALLPTASAEDRQAALGMAAINDLIEPVRMCLQAGADANAFLPVHRHCTPLHNAVLNDNVEMARLLIAHGARTDIADTLWDSTPLGWALHQGKANVAAYLQSLIPPTS